MEVSGRRPLRTGPPTSTRGCGPAGSPSSGGRAAAAPAPRRRRPRSLAVVGWASSLALRTPLLDVDAIEVAGNERTTAEAVVAAAGIARGDQLVDVDLHAAGEAVAALPWVQRGRAAPGDRRCRGGRGHRADRRSRSSARAQKPCSWTPRAGRSGPAFGDPSRSARRSSRSTASAPGSSPGEFLGDGGGRRAGGGRPPRTARSTWACGSPSRTAGSPGVVDPGIAVVFGDAGQLEAKVRSLRTVLEQVELTCAAAIDLRSPGSPVLTREEGCS